MAEILAENQKIVAENLKKFGAARMPWNQWNPFVTPLWGIHYLSLANIVTTLNHVNVCGRDILNYFKTYFLHFARVFNIYNYKIRYHIR